MLKTAIAHNGLSVIDVVSPCVTFNDHEGSTKSYSYMKEHEAVLHELDFVPYFEDIAVEIPEGEVMDVQMHDGSHLRIRKLDRDYDPTNRMARAGRSRRGRSKGEVLTGVLYVNPNKPDFRGSAEHGATRRSPPCPNRRRGRRKAVLDHGDGRVALRIGHSLSPVDLNINPVLILLRSVILRDRLDGELWLHALIGRGAFCC